MTDPWTGPKTIRFAGRLDASHTVVRRTLTVTLDGAFSVKLRGPATAGYDVEVLSGGKTVGSSSGQGAQDKLSFASACRSKPSERVTVAIVRRSGAGPFSAAVTYAG